MLHITAKTYICLHLSIIICLRVRFT